MLKHGVRPRHIQTGEGLFLLFNRGWKISCPSSAIDLMPASGTVGPADAYMAITMAPGCGAARRNIRKSITLLCMGVLSLQASD
ncbi:hypothetical protein EFQ99_10740 [Rhizobium vallis]|uniref:Uncharacterized protein n=1 Tax=Rhizobium vallis TaxID=634290 RepID=A0A432PMJ0_9HYPH|nr:hypothetical protein EFQ99_10740 [Rhizobium vallis]